MFISKAKLLSTAKSLFRAAGLEVSYARSAATEPNILRQLFRDPEIAFVLDVGANTGQYGRLVRRSGYRGSIVSFEPLKSAHDKLVRTAAADANWKVAERAALGAKAALTTINVAGNSVSSSLLPMNAQHIAAAPHSAQVGTEEVEVLALDDCIDQYIKEAGRGLLKIDTQGYEMEVLRGAHQTLTSRIKIVQTELSLVELYEGQPLMLDVCNLLKQYGFGLRDIIPGFKDPASGKLLQLDGIFSKN